MKAPLNSFLITRTSIQGIRFITLHYSVMPTVCVTVICRERCTTWRTPKKCSDDEPSGLCSNKKSAWPELVGYYSLMQEGKRGLITISTQLACQLKTYQDLPMWSAIASEPAKRKPSPISAHNTGKLTAQNKRGSSQIEACRTSTSSKG